MPQLEERALVLDSSDYRESSSLIRFFTENEGRISLVGRGLKKPKSATGVATIQPFNLVRIRYFLKEGATIGNLASSDIERVSSAPRNSLDAYAIISYWFEILKETSQAREASADIFNLTTRVLARQESDPGLTLKFLHEISELCQYLGFGISWSHCVLCGNASTAPLQFSITRGGIICPQCGAHENQGLTLAEDEKLVIADLNTQLEAPARHMKNPDKALFEILTLINRYLTFHLEHPLKTFSFLRTTLIG